MSGDIEIGEQIKSSFFDVAGRFEIGEGRRLFNQHIGGLVRAVGVQKGPGKIEDRVPPPGHAQSSRIGNHSHRRYLKIFTVPEGDETFGVFSIDDHRHPLLGFGNRKFRAVKAFVFFRHFIQIDIKAVRQFTDGHGHAAGAEIITTDNHAGKLGIAEKTLNFAFFNGIPFLNFGTALKNRGFGVSFGRACGPAAAVPSRSAADEQHHVARCRTFTAHLIFGNGGNDRPHFHAFGQKSGIVNFEDLPRGQPDLVAVGAVARRGFFGNFSLGKLAGKCIGDGRRHVPRSGQAHGLIDIGSAGQGVANGAAETGRRAAVRLNFCRVIVGFVFKLQKPILNVAVMIHFDIDRAGVDFLGLIEIIKQSPGFDCFGADGSEVHQGHGPVGVFTKKSVARRVITSKSLLDAGVDGTSFKINIGKMRRKGGVPAMIRPIGIDDAKFGHRRVPFFVFGKIPSDKAQIIFAHGKTHFFAEFIQLLVRKMNKPRNGFNGFRLFHGVC